jgi:hypothetical protein
MDTRGARGEGHVGPVVHQHRDVLTRETRSQVGEPAGGRAAGAEVDGDVTGPGDVEGTAFEVGEREDGVVGDRVQSRDRRLHVSR